MTDAKVAASTPPSKPIPDELMKQPVKQYHGQSLDFFQPNYRWAWMGPYHDFYERIGNELAFSPGFWTDLWAVLSLELSMPALIALYFLFEVLFFLSFGLLLFVTSGVAPVSYPRCVVAAVRAVTGLAEWDAEQFSILGESAGEAEVLSVFGSLVLLLEGYVHFLFVCIASSLIILRALRPLQQVAFSHHCVLSDEELTLRIRVLRPATTVLIHPEVRVDVCLNNGSFVKLPLVGGGTYAKWSGNPTITIRHKVDADSPFYDDRPIEEGGGGSTMSKFVHVSCSLVAQDANGTAVAEVQQYTRLEGFNMMIMGPHLDAVPGLRKTVPQILHNCKFEDQIQFRTATEQELAERNKMKIMCGLLPHPHAAPSNLRKELGSKRMVSDNDTFNRIAYVDSEIGKRSSATSKVNEIMEEEKKKKEEEEEEEKEKEEEEKNRRNADREARKSMGRIGKVTAQGGDKNA